MIRRAEPALRDWTATNCATYSMRRLHWIDVTTILYAAFVVYVSLVPFDFSFSPKSSHNVAWLGVPIVASGFPDAVSNLALYLPFGMLLRPFLNRRRLFGLAAIAAAAIGTGLLSFTVESFQLYSASRVSSWADVVCDLAGMLVGFAISMPESTLTRRLIPTLTGEVSRDATGVAAAAWAMAILVSSLIPFDIAFDVSLVAKALKQAYVVPFVRHQELVARMARAFANTEKDNSEALVALWQLRLDYLVDVLLYCMLAWLVARHLHVTGRRLLTACAGAVTIGTALALSITFAGLFVRSVGFDGTHAVLGAVGAVAGGTAYAMAAVVAPAHRRRRAATVPFHVTRGAWAASIALGWLYIAARELAPFRIDLAAPADNIARIEWMPLGAYSLSKVPSAAMDALHKSSRFISIGAMMTIYSLSLGARGDVRRCARVGVLTAAVVAAMEFLQCFVPGRYPDITDVLNAGLSAVAGAASAIVLRGWLTHIPRDRTAELRDAAVLNIEIPPPRLATSTDHKEAAVRHSERREESGIPG